MFQGRVAEPIGTMGREDLDVCRRPCIPREAHITPSSSSCMLGSNTSEGRAGARGCGVGAAMICSVLEDTSGRLSPHMLARIFKSRSRLQEIVGACRARAACCTILFRSEVGKVRGATSCYFFLIFYLFLLYIWEIAT